MRCALSLLFAFGAATACRTPSTTSAPAPSASQPGRAAPPVVASAAAPPPVARACSRDDECAVARIAPSGAHACCDACATTPGTRRWHAELQRFCAAHPPASCFPLACPMGPTFAVCRDGQCEATPSGPDGGPGFVAVERRCLPALVCDGWSGCTRARGNGQDGWFVEESDRVGRGEPVGLERVATADGGVTEAFRLGPPGVSCPPHTIPPVLPPPPFACSDVDGQCKTSAPR